MAYQSKYTGAEVDALLDKIKDDDVGNIDSSLSTTSENPVMNKVVTEELNKKLESSDMATINGQPLTEGGNIEVEAEPYDDTEIRDNLSELEEEIASNGVLIEDLQNMKIDKENDDYYPKMAVGLADNLAGVDFVDSEINFRRSGGGAISDGVARIESIKGNSVVWNQLATFQGTNTTNGITFTTNADGSITISGTATGNAYFAISDNNIYLANHKIAMYGAIANVGIMLGNNIITSNLGMDYIFSKSNSFENSAFLYVAAGTTLDSAVTIRPRITDLTKMFQAGNEPTTIEEFYARIPMGVDMNAYNEGEVIHMDVQSIESVGVNAWDEEWESGGYDTETGNKTSGANFIRTKNLIQVLGGQSYYITLNGKTCYAWLYDSEQKFIRYISVSSSNVLSIPSNCAYIGLRLGSGSAPVTTYNNDICINLSDASINGNYFPHIKRVEDLSIIHKYFPQGMKSAGTAHDEIRYNKASGKWEYSRGRMKEVDLGTLTWIQATATDGFKYYYTSKELSDVAYENNGNNILTPRYTPVKKGANEFADKEMRVFSTKLLYIRDDDYTDSASFKAAMQGVILYYESNDWEWKELDAEDQFKDLDYQVWNGGTEKSNAEGKSAPLAADITYGFNAIGKIKELEEAIKALQTTVASL